MAGLRSDGNRLWNLTEAERLKVTGGAGECGRHHFLPGSAIWLQRARSTFSLVSWSFHKHLQTALAARHCIPTPPPAVDSSAPRECQAELRKQRFGSAPLISTFCRLDGRSGAAFIHCICTLPPPTAVISTNAPSVRRRCFFWLVLLKAMTNMTTWCSEQRA